jgi:hypothetical protein
MRPNFAEIVSDATSDAFGDEAFEFFRDIFKPSIEEVSKDDTVVNNILENIYSSTQMALSIYAAYLIQEYIERIVKRLVLGYSFLNASKLLKKLEKFKLTRFIAKQAGKYLSTRTQTNAMYMQSILASSDNLDTLMQQERHHLLDSNLKHKEVALQGYIKSDDKKYIQYTHLSQTGTWENNQKHKKLFEDVTGEKITFSDELVEKLNSFSNYARTATGAVINSTEASLKLAMSVK